MAELPNPSSSSAEIPSTPLLVTSNDGNNRPQNKIVKLNIGGSKFATTTDTLTSIPDTYFSAMFSGRWDLILEEDGTYFVDRDPFVFRYILNYMREFPSPTLNVFGLTREEQTSLAAEAEYYQISPLRELVNQVNLYEINSFCEKISKIIL